MSQVDFSRGGPVLERVRARILGKALKEFKEQQPGRNWLNISRTSLSFVGWTILLVIVVIVLAWGFENLVPQKGANLLSNGSATAAAISPTATVHLETATPTLDPVQTPTILPGTFVTPIDGVERMVRSGPGTRYEPVGQL